MFRRMARRSFSEGTLTGAGFDVILGDDDRNQAEAMFDSDDGWTDVADPANPVELRFRSTWFEVMPARE